MLYSVYGKHVTSPKTFIRLEADIAEDATAKAEEKGWTVERVEPFVPPVAKPSLTSRPVYDPTPQYEALWIMAMLLRVCGVLWAMCGLILVLPFERPDLMVWVDEIDFVPHFIVGIVFILFGFETYVLGEAVAAFRHLVQNSWAWRRTQR